MDKTSKQLERHFKGISNHRRIDILLLIDSNNGISLEGIAESSNCNIKTLSEHRRRLSLAGLKNITADVFHIAFHLTTK